MSTRIPPQCPVCAGDGVPLGTLGRLRWFRYRDCGMNFSRQTGAPRPSRRLIKMKKNRMEKPAVASLQAQAEPLASLSISHLSSSTRLKLADDELSVNAYPTDCGGFIYVGAPRYRIPAEADLAAIFEVAEQAGIVWLKFDSEAAVIDLLPVYDQSAPGA
ncbi:hypothetical protein [Dechloromonas sp. A34]|uniref:DUF5983 family protein n=1 Tax=Dechloromonas sp. A34 TaxID=447588 RepID=UPI002248FC27|nr:hypothetical protein [Dechloromonas sp. A34]